MSALCGRTACLSRADFRACSIVLGDPRHAPYVLHGLWKIAMRRIADAKKA
jgi:hypothetical protein